MEPTDLTIEILKGIRDEVRATNEGLRATNEGLRATNEGLRATNERLDGLTEEVRGLARRQTETEIRLATEIVAVAGAINGLRDDLKQDRALRRRVDDHERRLRAIESDRRQGGTQ
jgi:hypothetical protein